MSDRIIRLLGTEVTLDVNVPTSLNNAQLVRVHAHSEAILTVKDGGTITGSCTLHNAETFYIRKRPTETIEVNAANCTAVAVGFGD